MKHSLILAFLFLSLVLVIFVGIAPAQQANWQQRNKTRPNDVNDLGAGNNVNPDPNSQVRIKVTNIPAGCTVKKITIMEEDWALADQEVQEPNFTQTYNVAITDWISPPQQTDDPGFHAEFYAIVVINCNGDLSEIETKGRINVPEGVIKEDEERIIETSTEEVGGKVSTGGKFGPLEGKGNITVEHRTVSQRKRIVDYGATYYDPTIDVTLIILSGPANWSTGLSLDPTTLSLGPGQSGSVYLVIDPLCSPGEGDIVVRSVVRETGFIDETDPLTLLILPPPPPIPTVSEWGLIIMAVLLLSAGAIVIMRRRQTVVA